MAERGDMPHEVYKSVVYGDFFSGNSFVYRLSMKVRLATSGIQWGIA